MLSSLKPTDCDKELHLKLLDLLCDAVAQFEAMNQLKIPDKIKKASVNDHRVCSEKFVALPSRELIIELKEKSVSTQSYINACTQQFFAFLEFYRALELLLVRHYMRYKDLEGNEYLKTAIDKIPDKEIKAIHAIPQTMPQAMPLSPRQGESTIHHRQRSNSSPVYPSWLFSSKKSDKKDGSPGDTKEATKGFK